MSEPERLLGKRHVYRQSDALNLEAKARKLGFSYSEIDILKELYEDQLNKGMSMPASILDSQSAKRVGS